MQVRLDHASARGVPLPENWKAAICCIGLPVKAAKAAKIVRNDMALDAVDCVLLGQPKSSPLPDLTLARVPGALVNLLYEGRRGTFYWWRTSRPTDGFVTAADQRKTRSMQMVSA